MLKLYYKLLFLLLLIHLVSNVAFSQDKNDYIGTWVETTRIVVGIDAHTSGNNIKIYGNGNYKEQGYDWFFTQKWWEQTGVWEITADNKLKQITNPSHRNPDNDDEWTIYTLKDNTLILESKCGMKKGKLFEFTAEELKLDIRFSKIYSEKDIQESLSQKIQLADELISQNNYEKAIEIYKYCINKDKSLEYTLNPKILDATIKLAEEKLSNNKFLESENLYKQALVLNPTDKSIENNIIYAIEKSTEEYKSRNKYQDAITKLNEIFKYEISPEKKEETNIKIADFYILEGDSYNLKENFESALKSYENSIKSHNNKTVIEKIRKLNEKIINNDKRKEIIEAAKHKLEVKLAFAFDINSKSESGYQKLFGNGYGIDLALGYKVLSFLSCGISLSRKTVSCLNSTALLIDYKIDTTNVSKISGDAKMTYINVGFYSKLGYFDGLINPYFVLKANNNSYSVEALSFTRYLPSYGGYTTEGTETKTGSFITFSYGVGIRIGPKSFKFDICFLSNNGNGDWLFKKYSSYELNACINFLINMNKN